jgi:DNA-directed RNA polymerase alpha subunit
MTQLIANLVGLIQEIEALSHNQDEIDRLRVAETVLSCDTTELLDYCEAHGHVQRCREAERERQLLATPIEQLGFSVRTYNCLKLANVDTLGELAGKTEDRLVSIRNFGRSSLAEVKVRLAEHDLKLLPDPVLLGDQFEEELRKAYPDSES